MSQTQTDKPLSKVGPWDVVAKGYGEVTMKMFRKYAGDALDMVGVNGESHVLDVACGTGTLALLAAPRVKSVRAVDFSTSMVQVLQDIIFSEGIANVDARCGDGQSLPFEDDQFDAAFSMFGLMFFPDRMKGHAEILRTLKPGGTTVISSWAPIAESSLMQAMFGALQAINPNMTHPEADVESLENIEFFKQELEAAGYEDVEIKRVDGEIHFDTAEGFWTDLVKGSAPLAVMKQNIPAEQWAVMSHTAVRFIRDRYGADNLTFNALANLGTGRKPS